MTACCATRSAPTPFAGRWCAPIVGTLVEVGVGKRRPGEIMAVLRSGDRRGAGSSRRRAVCASGTSLTERRCGYDSALERRVRPRRPPGPPDLRLTHPPGCVAAGPESATVGTRRLEIGRRRLLELRHQQLVLVSPSSLVIVFSIRAPVSRSLQYVVVPLRLPPRGRAIPPIASKSAAVIEKQATSRSAMLFVVVCAKWHPSGVGVGLLRDCRGDIAAVGAQVDRRLLAREVGCVSRLLARDRRRRRRVHPLRVARGDGRCPSRPAR